MARTVEATPEGNKARNYEQQGYGTEVVLDQICHLHQQSKNLNAQTRDLTEITKNMLEVQMGQMDMLKKINTNLERLHSIDDSLDRLEHIEKSLERLEPIQVGIEKSTTEIDHLEDVMSDFAESQELRSKEFSDTVHTMIEVFQGEENIEKAAEKGKERSKQQRDTSE